VDDSRELVPVHGAVRRMPPPWIMRLMQALTLWLLVRSLGLMLARWVLGLRWNGTLELRGDDLVLDREITIWGRSFKKSTSILPRAGLAELTLEIPGESTSFVVGLSSLCVGTFFGVRLISEGFFSGATSLLGVGAGLVFLGIAFDFLQGSGRREPSWKGPAQLVIRATAERGWVLSQVEPQAAQVLLARVQSDPTVLQSADQGQSVAGLALTSPE
jgi:hypothetical protein